MDSRDVLDLAAGLAIVVLLVLLAKLVNKRTASQLLYPPGPKPLPFVGNLFDIPRKNDWLVYQEWAKTYGNYLRNGKRVSLIWFLLRVGDVVHTQALGQHIIILDSVKAAHDIFERRSADYSGRPATVMFTQL